MTEIISKSFQQLTNVELYQLLKLRIDVFVVEQNCPYSDLDDLDLNDAVQHLLMVEGNELIAYARCLPPALSYPESAAIGRVIVAKKARGRGLAVALMEQAIAVCQSQWRGRDIEISAQCYLVDFYQNLGFECIGEQYLEDGIAHIHMKLV